MELVSAQSYLSTNQKKRRSFSCGLTTPRRSQSHGRSSGHKPPSVALLPGSPSITCFCFKFAKLHLFRLMDPAAAPISRSFRLFWIIRIDVSHSSPTTFFLVRGCQKRRRQKWKYPHYANAGLHWWHVLVFRNCIPPCQKSNCIWATSEKLSRRFQFGVPAMPPSI